MHQEVPPLHGESTGEISPQCSLFLAPSLADTLLTPPFSNPQDHLCVAVIPTVPPTKPRYLHPYHTSVPTTLPTLPYPTPTSMPAKGQATQACLCFPCVSPFCHSGCLSLTPTNAPIRNDCFDLLRTVHSLLLACFLYPVLPYPPLPQLASSPRLRMGKAACYVLRSLARLPVPKCLTQARSKKSSPPTYGVECPPHPLPPPSIPRFQ